MTILLFTLLENGRQEKLMDCNEYNLLEFDLESDPMTAKVEVYYIDGTDSDGNLKMGKKIVDKSYSKTEYTGEDISP